MFFRRRGGDDGGNDNGGGRSSRLQRTDILLPPVVVGGGARSSFSSPSDVRKAATARSRTREPKGEADHNERECDDDDNRYVSLMLPKTTTTTTTGLDAFLDEGPQNVRRRCRCDDLLLPGGDRDKGMDEIDGVVDSCRCRRPRSYRYYDEGSPERLVYVGQREMAHATERQCDVVLSTKATTCHVVAFRSRVEIDGDFDDDKDGDDPRHPLVTMAHIDGASSKYGESLGKAIERHIEHHVGHRRDGRRERGRAVAVVVDVHVAGGYDDHEGSSRSITDWFFRWLSAAAAQYKGTLDVKFVLRTCAVSRMNDVRNIKNRRCCPDHKQRVTATPVVPNGRSRIDGNHTNGGGGGKLTGAPVARGLAIDVRTGRAFLAGCDETKVGGPELSLRSARIWSSSSSPIIKDLAVVHGHDDDDGGCSSSSSTSGTMRIQPFHYRPLSLAPALLSLSDEQLLQYTSTSPECEEDDFAPTVRATLSYMTNVPCEDVFGTNCDRTLLYRRRYDDDDKTDQRNQPDDDDDGDDTIGGGDSDGNENSGDRVRKSDDSRACRTCSGSGGGGGRNDTINEWELAAVIIPSTAGHGATRRARRKKS